MSALGVLNFLVLQWFGVRLACSYNPREIPGWQYDHIHDAWAVAFGGRWWSRYAPPRCVRIRWVWLRWIVPLTGWWSDFRYVTLMPLFTRERFRWVQRLTRVRRIHHPRWSFGWAFPLTTWCRFERMTYKDHDVEPPAVKTRAGHWKRCDRGSYHDSTTTGRY